MSKKRFDTPWSVLIDFIIFHIPILAATTHAATIKAQFIAEWNKHAGVLLKIAPNNIFSMAIRNQLGKANWPGRGWSGPVPSHFYPLIEGYLVVRVQFPLPWQWRLQNHFYKFLHLKMTWDMIGQKFDMLHQNDTSCPLMAIFISLAQCKI